MSPELIVLYEDAAFLVVDKPSGIPTTSPDGRGALTSLVEAARPKAAKHHPTSRLDAEVSGVVTFALSSRAIEHALAMRAAARYERRYVGLTCTPPAVDTGRVVASIAVDPRDKRRRIVDDGPSAIAAASRFRVRARAAAGTLLELAPETGRTHQLRVHASHLGSPLAGDVHYGGPRRATLPDGRVVTFRRVMLHCARVSLPGLDGRVLAFESALPPDFATACAALGLSLDACSGLWEDQRDLTLDRVHDLVDE